MNILFFITPKSEVKYLHDCYTIRQAIEKLEDNRYTSIPVIDDQGKYVSTITEGDILWKIKNDFKNEKYELNIDSLETMSIKDINKYNNYETVSASSDMESLIDLAKHQNFIPVVDDQNIFIGIIKRSDIIAYFNISLNSKKTSKSVSKVS
ncbi:MAG: CBS domain-containing protein [Paraclostridium sp.]|uniref:CBS domain-containing protein n=1 Tax=Paraclostridium sp. TaxID=2023273 RepID=UPI003F30B40A